MATNGQYRQHFKVLPEHEWPDEYEHDAYSGRIEPAWYKRERDRFHQPKEGEFGEPAYRALPGERWHALTNSWGAGTIMGHFAHYSVTHPGMIAFTKSFAHGVADRQTVMKPGRYLSTYFADSLSAPEIARLAGMVSALTKPPEVRFARTAEDIRRIYRNGPSSCMVYGEGEYSTRGIHPTAVYAGPDTAVAYMLSNADDPDSVTARSVVVMEGDEPVAYTRVYGDADRLVDSLRGMGLAKRMTLDGVRLPRIPVPESTDTFVMPYLDNLADRGWMVVTSDPSDPDDYFMVHHVIHGAPRGAVSAQNTRGVITFYP